MICAAYQLSGAALDVTLSWSISSGQGVFRGKPSPWIGP